MRFTSLLTGILLLVAAATIPSISVAQTASVPSPAAEASAPVDSSTWAPILDNAARVLERQGVSEEELNEISAETDKIRLDANQLINELQPRVNEFSQQITELGAEPPEGGPSETAEVQKRRETLNAQFAEVDAQLKAARLAMLRAQQLQRMVIETRQAKFFRSITVRSNEIYELDFWNRIGSGAKGTWRSFQIIVVDGYKIAIGELAKKPWKIGVVSFLLLLAFYVFFMLRRKLGNYVLINNQKSPSNVFKSRFLELCKYGFLPAILIFAIYQILWEAFLLTPRMGELFANIGFIAGFYTIAIYLLRIVVLPGEGRSRLMPINDAPARNVVRILMTGLCISGVLAVLNAIAIVTVARLQIAVSLSLLFALTISISFIAAFFVIQRDRSFGPPIDAVIAVKGFWLLAKYVVQITAIVIFFSAVFGYVALAEFLAQQLVFGLVVIGSVWLILRFVQNLAEPAVELATEPVDTLSGYRAEEGNKTNQLKILGAGLLTLFLYLGAAILLLLPWGYRTSDFYQIFESVFFGFEIGGLRISVSTVLTIIALFVIGYMITVSLRSWFKTKFLPTTSLGDGVSNSISTIIGYMGFILAAIFAISAAGFDLSNLAIVAGALSVGVGFGLQSIVNNFVSGLILLAERPIKTGDWIVTSGGQGFVTKISVRSTEIETFDRSAVIIPNSTLITDNVTNWTHENRTGRIIVSVGVGYNSDVEKVKEILLQCAKDNRLVLGRPEPVVFFMDFGVNSLDFELRCFLSDITYMLIVQSELRFSILAALREANIEIPFPQRDLHIKSGLLPTEAAAQTPKTES